MGNIKDKVAIIGMGCTPFGELWDKGYSDLIIDAAYEAAEDAGIDLKDVEAGFIGNLHSGLLTAAPLSESLQWDCKPVTRVENNCATGAEALRVAAFSVASGMYDVVLALGVEKCKDGGSGMLEAPGTTHPVLVTGSAPASFAKAAVRYFEQYGISREEGKRLISTIAVKNHFNGSLSPKAMFRKSIAIETAIRAPIIAWPLGLYDCCPVSDGAAAAIVCRADLAKKRFKKDNPILIKGVGLAAGRIDPAKGKYIPDRDITFFDETWAAAKQAYDQAGVKDPRKEISLAEVHDCFTITEMLIYESLGFCPKGKAKEDMDAGSFNLRGVYGQSDSELLPVNPDGGLKAFGHPVGASGLRMVYEGYNQLLGKAGARQIKDVKLALSHSQGGMAGHGFQSVVTIIGRKD